MMYSVLGRGKSAAQFVCSIQFIVILSNNKNNKTLQNAQSSNSAAVTTNQPTNQPNAYQQRTVVCHAARGTARYYI